MIKNIFARFKKDNLMYCGECNRPRSGAWYFHAEGVDQSSYCSRHHSERLAYFKTKDEAIRAWIEDQL